MSRLCLLLLAISSFENIIAGVIPSGFECSDNTKLAVAEALNIADREIMTTEHSGLFSMLTSLYDRFGLAVRLIPAFKQF